MFLPLLSDDLQPGKWGAQSLLTFPAPRNLKYDADPLFQPRKRLGLLKARPRRGGQKYETRGIRSQKRA